MDHNRSKRREMIRAHLESIQRLNEAARQVMENHLSIHETARNYKLTYRDLSLKLKNIRNMKQFKTDRPVYEYGVKEFFKGRCRINVAKITGIIYWQLCKEVTKARSVGLSKYKYDKQVNFQQKSIFSYMEEESLLDQLIIWNRMQKDQGQGACSCRICALEMVSTFALYMIQIEEKYCPPYWTKHGQTDIGWLIEFEMRHSDEISPHFKNYDYAGCLLN